MVRVNFNPDDIDWQDFFAIQRGGGYWFEGMPNQRGYGIGAVASGIFKFLLPFAKRLGMELGKEGIATGQRILEDLHEGQNIKKSLKTETQQGLKNLVDNVYTKRKTQSGAGKQKAIKGDRKPRKVIKHNSIVGKLTRVGPRKRIDY